MSERERKSRSSLQRSAERKVSLSVRKKVVFSLLTVVLTFGVLEMVLLAVGVETLLAEKDPYVGFASQIPLLVERQIDGQAFMETAPNKLRWFNAQQFPKEKSPDSYRIFSVGGSTTYGRPYDDRSSFSGWLRELLVAADKTRHWEVFNAGGISYASYRVVRVMEELSDYEPDLFIVYTGHNEFLEERTYRDVRRLPSVLRNVGAVLSHTRSFAVLHRMLHPESDTTVEAISSSSSEDRPDNLAEEVRTRLDGGIGPDAYQRDDELAGRILEHFRFNLLRMIKLAHDAGAEIVLITPASNLADCSPFKSEHEPPGDDHSEWQARYNEAKQAYQEGRYEVAEAAIVKALELAPRHSHSHYLHGRILQAVELHDRARVAYVKARDEDVCSLRAHSQIVQIVREVAQQQRVPIVDFERLIDKRSAHQLPGESLFLDHVHPTIEGNRLLGLALFDFLGDQQVVTRPPGWDAVVDGVVQHVEREMDSVAHGEALRNLSKVLAWAGKTEEANALALKASRLIGGDAETAYMAGNALLVDGQHGEAMVKLQEALRIDPQHVQALNSLGTVFFRQGRLDEALKYYQRVAELQPDFVPVYNNLGALYQRRRETELAIKSYEHAIRLNPRYSKAYNNVGVLLRQQGKDAEAADHFRKALEINADFPEAHFNLGTIFDNQGDAKSAHTEYQQAVRLNPRYAPAYHRIGIHLEEQRQWRSAMTAYRNALQSPAPPVNAACRLAWILATCPDASLRNGKLALQLAQGCTAATKNSDPDSLSALAAAYAETNDLASAVKWQLRALRLAASKDKPRHQSRLDQLRSRRALRAA